MSEIADAKSLGRIIRIERKKLGYTQTKLARYAGVSINFVSQLENGKETAEIGKVMRVLHALGIDLVALKRGE